MYNFKAKFVDQIGLRYMVNKFTVQNDYLVSTAKNSDWIVCFLKVMCESDNQIGKSVRLI